MSASDDGRLDAGMPQVGELGRLLRDARVERGLELTDIAERTHVRLDYLRSLEEGNYEGLPEDVYTRNFVRLYAKAVGVGPDEAVEVYQRERQLAGGLSTMEVRLERERRGEPPPPPRPVRGPAARRGPSVGPTVLTLLLVVGLVALAVWGYNSLFFRSGAPTPARSVDDGARTDTLLPGQSEAPTPGAADPVTAAPPAATGTVLIDVISAPPGARVTIDGFQLPGVTPIRSAPVTAREGRVVRVALEGYDTWEQTVDLSEGRTIEANLTQAAADELAPATGPDVAQGQVALTITAPSWLEVYRGGARNQGERLVYTTAQPGATYTFDLPVYVYAGNAAGVEVTVGDAPPFVLGSSGAIVGRAFQ